MPATRGRRPRGGRGSMSPVSTGVVAALGNCAAKRPDELHAVDDERGAGADQQLLLARGQRDRVRPARLGRDGSPSSSAPTVVSIEVCTNWPATAMIGPRPHGSVTARCLLRAASAAAIGRPCASSAVTSARAGGLSWSKPSAVRSMTSSQSRMRHLDRVGDLRPQRHASALRRRRPAAAPAGRRRGRPRPASDVRAASTNSASPAAPPPLWAAGSFSVRFGGVPVLHHALRRGPRGARVAVGGRVGGAEHVDRVGVAGGPSRCPAG